nr:putative ribonuclease H-like domain-containing protein [Tanacetum cinerariifolium]
NFSVETVESVPKPVESKPKAVSEPKVWSNALIIKEYESISDDEYVFKATIEQEIPNNLHQTLKRKGIIDSGCSRHMMGNKAHLVEYHDFNGGPIAFGGIKKEYCNARTPQQNEVAERKNMTRIEAARTMLADLFLPNTFWAKEVSTACYVLNRVVVTKPKNKTPYELITGKIPIISYIRPFGFHVTILNTIDHLGKFEEKFDEGFLVGYSLNSKAFRPVTAKNKANKTASPKEANNSAGPIEFNHSAGTEANDDQGENLDEIDLPDDHFPASQVELIFQEELEQLKRQEKEANDEVRKETTHKTQNANTNSTNLLNVVSTQISTDGPSITLNDGEPSYLDDPLMPHLEMDMKIAFLYGKISEEVYVSQPPGFIDSKFLNKVYKVVKALYGLHQALRAWYATLYTFLVKSRYRRGIIECVLFIKKDKKDIMLVQVYVDDIIFGSTKKSWCDEFEALMKSRFQMSSIGELTFFLRLQVTPKISHLHAVKRIFRYLKGQPKLGIWYPRELTFDMEAYSDSDYARENLDRKSKIGGCQFLGRRLISWQCKRQTIMATSTTVAEYVAVANCCGQGNPQQKEYKEKGVIDSGFSRHMTRNKCFLFDYEDYDGGFVSFGDGKGRISGKGTKDNIVAGQAKKKKEPEQEYILIPICTTDSLISQCPKDSVVDARNKATKVDES